MVTTTRNRVPRNTAQEINRRILRDIENSIRYYQQHKTEIAARLQQLDEEWDIERAIEANAALVGLFGLARGLMGRPLWFLLPAAVGGFLLQHAVQGWCPPVPVLRRLGFRTSHEIEQERQALKLIRGDYQIATSGNADVAAVLEAVAARTA